MPPPAQDLNNQFGAMNMNVNSGDGAGEINEEDNAQNAIDDIFADIKPATDSGAQNL